MRSKNDQGGKDGKAAYWFCSLFSILGSVFWFFWSFGVLRQGWFYQGRGTDVIVSRQPESVDFWASFGFSLSVAFVLLVIASVCFSKLVRFYRKNSN